LLVTFLLNQVQGAVQSELDRFFQVLHGKTVALREVSAAALTKARRKLSHTAFIELNQCLMASTAEALPLRRWHGLRLLAVDGSKLRLPNLPVMREQFGVGTNGNKETPVAMALLSTLYDVLNHVTVDAQVDRYDASERDLALAHLDAIGPGSLVMFDRGYPAFWLFAAMQARGIDFCVRVPWNLYKACETLVIRGLREDTMTLKPTAEARRQCQALGIAAEPLTLRLVRVVLDSGEPEVLVTSLLDTSAFPAAEFKGLYHLRWPVEESYKRDKHALRLENFSGRTVQAILQDIHATVLTHNLTALLAFEAQHRIEQRTAHRRHGYQVNWTRAFSKVRHTLARLLLGHLGSDTVTTLIEAITQDCEAVRPGRTFPRRPARSRPNGRASGYKPVCA
jgi:hypothetical protein